MNVIAEQVMASQKMQAVIGGGIATSGAAGFLGYMSPIVAFIAALIGICVGISIIALNVQKFIKNFKD